MESMPQLESDTVDIVAPDPVIKEKALEKRSKKCGDSGPFPALNEVNAIPETPDAGCYTESEWVASDDSADACSLESDASSNAISGNSLISDADSLAPSCEEKIVKKCPSGGSIVTYDEAVSKINGEGDCKASDERHRRGRRYQTDSQFDEQDTSIDTAPRMAESAGKAWTDDKHCSYLNSIEATFVRSLYEQDYRAVDMSEQDQDCVESRPMDPGDLTYHAGGELFTSLQRGCYDQREYYRPHYIFAPSTAPAVFASPWIQHFSPRIAPPAIVGGGAQDVFAGHTSSGYAEGSHCGNYMYQGVMEEVMESVPVLPDAPQVPHGWNSRYQSQLGASTSAPVRPDASIPAKKRGCNQDPCTEGVYRPKKLKSTQQKLAETDLELEEQFVLEQLNQKEDGNRVDLREAGWRLDGRSNLRRPKRDEESDRSGAQILQDTPPTQSAADDKPTVKEEQWVKEKAADFRESEENRSRRDTSDQCEDCETRLPQTVDPGRKDSSVKPHDCHIPSRQLVDYASRVDSSARKDAAGCSGQHTAGVQEMGFGMNVVGPAGTRSSVASRLKIALDESSPKCQPDARYDEHDECNFVAKISPRACRTYTWGLMGGRRPLLSGNAKDSREDESISKEQPQ